MMWIVRLALRRPYTFVVFALLILILGVFSIETMPTDIFPDIDIPIITVVWNFIGLSPQEMSTRIIFISERSMTTTVSDIEHMESQSFNGVGLIKVYFQPGVNIANATAQVTAINQAILRLMPNGTLPPFILQYNAASVPVLQLGLSGKGLNEQQLSDLGFNNIRVQLATIEGAQITSLWRQDAPDPGRSRSAFAASQGAVSGGCEQRDQRAKCDRSLGNHQDRSFRVRS